MIFKSGLFRGVARISQGGVQFAEILLTTPTFKKLRPFIRKLRGTAFNIIMRGFFYYFSLQKNS